MGASKYSNTDHYISQAQKNARDFEWYRTLMDYYDTLSFKTEEAMWNSTDSSKYRMKVNYDLVGNKIDPSDFTYVTNPWRENVGELPAKLENRDIINQKLSAVLGIEYKRPFEYEVLAVNSDATTRKEKAETEQLRNLVLQAIMQDQEEGASLPPDAKKYIRREYQDPAEVLGSQLLKYESQRLRVSQKFNKGLKHLMISAWEVYYVGEENGDPVLRPVNPLLFDCDGNQEIPYIEDRQWAVCEYRMTPVDVVRIFGRELDKQERESVFSLYEPSTDTYGGRNSDEDYDYVSVRHFVFKSLRKIGFVKYLDENGEEQEMLVDETYQKMPTDIAIRWEWIPEVHEGWRIGKNIYKRMRPIPGQHKSIETLYECKLPYYGIVYDNDNTEPVSLVDRVRSLQYLYNILMYRIELLMAQDKGKKVAIDISAIPTKSAGITLAQFEKYIEGNNYFYLNSKEEGNRYQDVTQLVKEIDLTTTSDINKYVQLAQYINQMAGYIMGVTPQLEGQIQEREAVQNVNKALTLSTNSLEPLFQAHDQVKKNVLQALVEQARYSYAVGQPRKLNYILDDMSVSFLTVNQDLLDNTVYGVFITDNSSIADNKEVLKQLAHAAMQNQMVNLSTVLKVMRASYLGDAEEILLAGEDEMQEAKDRQQQLQMEAQQQQFEQAARLEEIKHQQKMELIQMEADLKYKLEIDKAALVATGFNEDKDMNNNQVPDTMDYAKILLEKRKLDIKDREVDVKEKALNRPMTKK